MKTLLIVLGLTASVAAHGIVTSVVARGKTYPGFDTRIGDESSKPTVGWKIPDDTNLGFILPDQYAAPDIICHKNAAPASESAVVEAGGSVELQWTTWPDSHHGPVITYLANCHGSCETVDKTQLKFNKIEAVGLYSNSTTLYTPGKYASDQLIQNGNKWTVTIPSTIARGNYVLRHEIIALHSAYDPNGAQNYPQCINLEITGSGTDALTSGTLGENLYKANEPGILISIYKDLNYIIPGPLLYAANEEHLPAPAEPLTSQSSYAAASSSTWAADSSLILQPTTTARADATTSDSATLTTDSSSATTPSQSPAFSTGTPFRNTTASSTTAASESISFATPSVTLLATSDTSPTATKTSSTPIYNPPPSISTSLSSLSSSSSESAPLSSVLEVIDSSTLTSKSTSRPSSSSPSASSSQPETGRQSSTFPSTTQIPIPQNATVQELLDLLWRVVTRLRQMGLRAGTGTGSTKRRHARDLVLEMEMD